LVVKNDREKTDISMVTIELPESVLVVTGQSREEFVREAKLILAAKLFEEGRISSGKDAELCAMPRVDFLLAVAGTGWPGAAELPAAPWAVRTRVEPPPDPRLGEDLGQGGWMPWLQEILRPSLERKGQRVKEQMRARARAS
jgi:predicted HTH domain antitoxin